MIIALSGAGNTGKSTILKKLMNELLEEGWEPVRFELCNPISKQCKKYWNGHDSIYELFHIEGDMRCIFKKHHYVIGITSQGDSAKYLNENFQWIEKICTEKHIRCNCYICAVLSRGQTLKYVEEFAVDKGEFLSVCKHISSNESQKSILAAYDCINSTQTRILMNKIRRDMN